MSNKIFLTSGLVIGLAICPAIADETLYTQNIDDACTVDILGGTGSGNAANSFIARYAPKSLDISAGQYLASNEISGTICPANSYCIGGTFTFSETLNQGLTSCPSDYSLSVAGSSAQTDCYRLCTTTDVAHSSGVTGNYHYGNANNCGATACVIGYHVETSGPNPLLNKENIGGNNTRGHSSLNDKGGSRESEFGLTPGSGEFISVFSHGSVKGQALCSTTTSSSRQIGTPVEGGTGKNCWCKLIEYTPNGESAISISSSWIYHSDFGGANDCAGDCSMRCVQDLDGNTDFRRPLFNSVVNTSVSATCVANDITITWKPENGEDDITNQCTYDGDITIPTLPERFGYDFLGWELVTDGSSN